MTRPSPSNVIRFPFESKVAIEQVAASWLVRMRSELPSAGDIVEHALWRAESTAHDSIYRDMERVWIAAGATTFAKRRGGLFHRLVPHRPWLGMRNALVAASVIATLGGAAVTQQYLSVWQYDYVTPTADVRTIALADGSTVIMKGGTALNIGIGRSGARTVELARGEAFFEVAHDAARPFTVDAGSAVVQDLGTGFAVERHGQSGEVSVDHGTVKVAAAGQSDVLSRGQQVRFGLYDLGDRNRVDTDAIAAWRRGLYVAQDKPLSDVLRDLDAYRSGRIIVTSAALRDRRINAVVQLNHIDAWLDTLGRTQGVSLRRWGSFVIVSADAR